MGHPNLLEKPGRLMLTEESRQNYQWVQNNGQGYLQLPLLNQNGIFHLFGTRLMPPGTLKRYQAVVLRQVHGDRVLRVTETADTAFEEAREGDGLITNLSQQMITVGTADCTPILLFDPVKKAVGAVHAGWRGSVMNIVAKAVQGMLAAFGSQPEDIFAGIGPTISTCCFEVGPDVAEALEGQTPYGDFVLHEKTTQGTEKKWTADLVQLNRLQLIDAGLPSDQIVSAGLCTHCLPNLFYSFRRDKEKMGNMISGIMLL